MKKRVWCTTQVVGFHNWPTAPAEVAFLRERHRHVFHIKVEVNEQDTRGVEFTLLRSQTESVLVDFYSWKSSGYEFRDNACETIASNIILALRNCKVPVCAVEVSEDGENGVRIECA